MECEKELHFSEGDKRTVLIAHDESIFYSNEFSRIVWLQHGQRQMRPKSKSRSLLVSGFCCPCHGFVRENIEDGATVEKKPCKHKHAEEGTPTFNRCCGRRRFSLHEISRIQIVG